MTIQEMKQKKKELGYTNEMVSALSGVPLGTVQKVFARAAPHHAMRRFRHLKKRLKMKNITRRVWERKKYNTMQTG
ncbi:MAG: hypothetical protein ACLTST_07950 [Lachnospiraceae bacterium]